MVSIVEIKTRPVTVQASVVQRLEETLARAKAGELVSVAIASVSADGSIHWAWSEGDHLAALLGAASHLQFKLNQHHSPGD